MVMRLQRLLRRHCLALLPLIPLFGCGGAGAPSGVGAYTGRVVLPGGKAAQIGLVARPNGTVAASLLPDSAAPDRQVDLTGTVGSDGSFRLATPAPNPIVVEGFSGAGGSFTLQIGSATGNGRLAPAPATATAPFLPNYAPTLTKPQHWNRKELAVWIDAGAEARSADALWAQMLDAGKLWSDRLPGLFAFRRAAGVADAQIVVRFVPPTDGNVSGERLGQTRVKFYQENRELVGADIYIETGIADGTLQKVLAHELGHALGINGHSSDQDDLMYAVAFGPTNLTLRDANTLARIYSAAGR